MYQVTIPGKLIISGEHAVIYGNPALAAAIDRYVQVRLSFIEEPNIQFTFADYKQPLVNLSFADFWQAVEQLEQRYQLYLKGECSVTEITKELYDLPIYALGLLAKATSKEFTQGVRITISGDLPMGYGLGSSAAVIVGILRIASQLFAYPFDLQEMQQLALQVENLQHGRSSGLDPCVCLHGGVVLYSATQMLSRTFKPWSAYLINTGQPQSSTGECVSWVKEHSPIQSLLKSFEEVVLMCDHALQRHSTGVLRTAIRENHRLLCELDVVPARIQACIAELEKHNYAAKICGAGSIIGESAGYLLVIGEQRETITEIAHDFDFTTERVQLGVYL